ncbi:amidohydrolase family protein [Propionibacteriaceae bacterium G1746]|uniref:amidohydrolase n=1 Tax=Aestuariimicrobium sp. G57 TaxID=3418485 RepID=UPI003C281643
MPITLANVRHLDLVTGEASSPTDLHIVDGHLARAPHPDATIIDGRGGIVMPGLWDAHVHIVQWAMTSRWVDVSPAGSPAEAAQLMAEADQTSDTVLVGFGFRDSRWATAPQASDLDAVITERPVVLLSADVHSAWLNTAALHHFGLDIAVHDNGLLREHHAFVLQTRLVDQPSAVIDGWVAQACRAAAALGVVGFVDLTMDENITSWQRRFSHGFDTLRVRAGVYPQHLESVATRGLRGGQVLDDHGLLTLGPLKVITDGSLTARTAWCHHPYAITGIGDPAPGFEYGTCNVPLDDLVALMMRANALGMECAVHAIGDRAVAQALAAFAETEARGSIEHAQLVDPADMPRMAALGVRASVQPAHVLDDWQAIDTLWPGQARNAYPFVGLASSGVELALGSDAPVAPLNPWLAIESAVRRSSGTHESWHPEQALTLSQALRASTRGVHQLVVGAPADLLVLPVNPFELADDQVHALRPNLTMVAGRITHQR